MAWRYVCNGARLGAEGAEGAEEGEGAPVTSTALAIYKPEEQESEFLQSLALSTEGDIVGGRKCKARCAALVEALIEQIYPDPVPEVKPHLAIKEATDKLTMVVTGKPFCGDEGMAYRL